MTATLTATPDPSNAPPRMILAGAGFAGSTVTVTRTDANGTTALVRGVTGAALTGGAFIAYDYEVPYGSSASWTAVSSTGVTAAGSGVAPVAGPWLVHPGIPSLSQPLTITGMGDVVSDINQGIHRPLGRRTPIVITDGQRRAPTFDLTLLTSAQADEDRLTDLLDDASTLLLQIAYDPSVGVNRTVYAWVSIGQVTQSRLAPYFRPDLGGDDFQWTLPCTVSSRPSGSLQAQRTWADVVAGNATWADVVSKYATWRDLILDNSGTAVAAVTADTVAVADLGGGVLDLTGAGVSNGGAGVLTLTLSSPGDVDNGDGTLTLV